VGADFDATGANAHIPHSTTRDARDDEKREKPDGRADERTREASSTRTEPTRAVKMADFYATLGISKADASDETKLKKAYKKAAMKSHPDRKGGNAERFKRVGLAYDTLSDPSKRAVYDRYGEEGLKAGFVPPEERASASGGFGNGNGGGTTFRTTTTGGGGFPGGAGYQEFSGADAEKLFRSFFGGGGSPFGSGGAGGGFDFGGVGNGGGGFDFGGVGNGGGGFDFGGGGAARKRRRPENIVHLECTLEELFRGTKKMLKLTRKVNAGGGQLVDREETMSIDVKPGWKAETKITFERRGNEEPGEPGQGANLVVVIKEKPHAWLRREKDDLIYEVPSISLRSALVGFKMSFVNVDGEKIEAPFDECTSPGSIRTLRGKGMPNQKTGVRGNLLLKIGKVEFPRGKLTAKQKSLIKEALATSAA